MFFLALLIAADIQTTPPAMIALHKKEDSCVLDAMRRNADPDMNTPEAKAKGVAFVCLTVVKADV